MSRRGLALIPYQFQQKGPEPLEVTTSIRLTLKQYQKWKLHRQSIIERIREELDCL